MGWRWMTMKGRRELKIFWFCIYNVPEPHNHEVLINCLGFNPQHRCDFLLGTSAHNSPLNPTLCLETLGLSDRKLHILFIILNSYRAPGMGPRINHIFKCKVGKFVINDWGKNTQSSRHISGMVTFAWNQEGGQETKQVHQPQQGHAWREHTKDC